MKMHETIAKNVEYGTNCIFCDMFSEMQLLSITMCTLGSLEMIPFVSKLLMRLHEREKRVL